MTRASERAGWVAPLLVGASAAVAGEVAIGILLYTGPGLMRSLTTILAVEGGALAAGLWRGAAPRGNQVERLRLHWLFCLAAFAAAAMFGTAWSVVEDVGGGRWGQGLGLAILAALPLFAAGLVLGGMSSLLADERSTRSSGASAALGAAIGFVITGLLLPRAPIPSSLLVACLVMLSGAGLVFGAVLGGRRVVHLRAVLASPTGEVRVEDRVSGRSEPAARYLLEGGHVRGRIELEGERAAPWEVAVADTFLTDHGTGARVLSLGGGASRLARALAERRAGIRLEVLERSEAVVQLAHDHLETGLGAPDALDASVQVGHLDDLVLARRGPYDLVLVDARALAPLGGAAGLSKAAWSALFKAAEGGGAVAFGPVAEGGGPAAPPGWGADTLPHGEGAVVLLRPVSVAEHHAS